MLIKVQLYLVWRYLLPVSRNHQGRRGTTADIGDNLMPSLTVFGCSLTAVEVETSPLSDVWRSRRSSYIYDKSGVLPSLSISLDFFFVIFQGCTKLQVADHSKLMCLTAVLLPT